MLSTMPAMRQTEKITIEASDVTWLEPAIFEGSNSSGSTKIVPDEHLRQWY